MKNPVFSTYEITPLTMALISKVNKQGKVTSFVLEEEQEYTVIASPTKMVEFACKYYGSSLRGRLDGTKDVSNITHKAPVAIDPSSGMYFYPTASHTKKHCSWISHTHIDFINQLDLGKRTEVIFKNGLRVILDVSFGSIQNQLHRTAQFRFSLDNRMKKIQDVIDYKSKNKDE